jgi:hypothetical protein
MTVIDEKIIRLSKTKIVLAIVGCCLFIVTGIWLLTIDPLTIKSSSLFVNPIVFRGAGLMSIVVFGYFLILGATRLLDKKPGLILNNLGIINNSSGINRFIPWSDIVGFYTLEIFGQQILFVRLVEPQKYIQIDGATQRSIAEMNYKLYGSPVAISSNALQINFTDLLKVVREYSDKYGETNPPPPI